MKSFVKPLKLGSLILPSNVFYAPLAGCSDYPFRKMCSYFLQVLTFCEMVKMDALIRHDSNTYRLLDYDKDMHPIGAQLCGSKVDLAAPCARIIEDLGFDVVDLNCGCPVDKVTKDGSGSGLLKTPDLIGEILYRMVKAVNIPVTVKIRAGWDDAHINAALITKIAEEAGAVAITIHGRTREQAYKGPANWSYIKACKDVAKTIQVIGNGDILDGPSALSIFEQTNCDGILISRGTLGKPWIAEEMLSYLLGNNPPLKTPQEVKDTFLKHFKLTIDYENNRKSFVALRRIGSWYLKQGPHTKELRDLLNNSSTLEEVISVIENYNFDLAFSKEEAAFDEPALSCDC